jgi:DNA ligase D-like protein (predicted polymerase)
LSFPSGRTAEEVVPRDAATLAWMANLACLELHPHPVRAGDLDHPDELRIDLDPVPGVPWSQLREVAHVVRATLDDLGLVGWPKTSGSRGMHVYVRIHQQWTFEQVRRAALAFAREVERRAPGLATSKWWKEERQGVFLDYNQNAKDRTIASAYSVRPKPDARVSAPLTWDEIDSCEPEDFTLATMPSRFASIGDRHAAIDDHPCAIDRLLDLSASQERDGLGDAPWPPNTKAGRTGARSTIAAPDAERCGCRRWPTEASPGPEASARRDRAVRKKRRGARGTRALESASSGRCSALAACRYSGRRHARTLSHLDAHPREPAARAARTSAAPGSARSR